MMRAKFLTHHQASDEGISFSFSKKPFVGAEEKIPFDRWSEDLAEHKPFVVGQLLAWVEEETALSDTYSVLVPHKLIAELGAVSAFKLGLPEPIPHVLYIQANGAITEERFSLKFGWQNKNFQHVSSLKRQGSLVIDGTKNYRMPEPFFSMIEVLERFNQTSHSSMDDRLKAWADIQEHLPESSDEALKIDGYLGTLRISHASSFSLNLKSEKGIFDFDPVLFSKDYVSTEMDDDADGALPTSAEQLLPPRQQDLFAQDRFRSFADVKGKYVLDGWYVVLDEDVKEALTVVKRAQSSDEETRKDFARNPRAYLQKTMGDKYQEAAIDALFIETSEYAETVKGIGLWEKKEIPWQKWAGDKWLPEEFSLRIKSGDIEKTITIKSDEVDPLRTEVYRAIEAGNTSIQWKGEELPATDEVASALTRITGLIRPEGEADSNDNGDEEDDNEDELFEGKVVLEIIDNFDEVGVSKKLKPRKATPSTDLPLTLKSTLKPHQIEGLRWLKNAWAMGRNGVLLADDMGLGKTLLSMTFLAWLSQIMSERKYSPLQSGAKAPILVVAPTGLLKNWEKEQDIHFNEPGIGSVCRAYGAHLNSIRLETGKELKIGKPVLDTEALKEADWILTTYETLSNYQHSFGPIRFAAIVYDEIQKTKTPGIITTEAAKAMNADFKIGLTGTPIENRLADLWCIIDTLEPGMLGDLKGFSIRYERDPDETDLKELKNSLQEANEEAPSPVMLRRMKENSLEGLPQKEIHPTREDMPAAQAEEYEEAIRIAKKDRGPGSMLKALHRLRDISLHPYHPEQADDPDSYINQSARLRKCFEILESISDRNEKALIFLESLDMQKFIAPVIQRKFGLQHLPRIINGSVNSSVRQKHVDAFESETGAFDVMILSPKAGGVGLTLNSANHVIHLSRWWNPAIEDQCNDRVYRIGQTKTVHIYPLIAQSPLFGNDSFDVKLDALLERKRSLSRDMLLPPVTKSADTEELFRLTVGGPAQEEQCSLEDIDRMNPEYFEEWVGECLRRSGYEYNRTNRSWDAGADGIAKHPKTGKVLIIQCKHKSDPTAHCNDDAILELLKARNAYNYPNARLLAVTNASGFTANAQTLAREKGVECFDRNKLFLIK